MKICIDGLGISQLHGTGLYSYSHGLLSNLLEMYPQPKYELIWEKDTDFDLFERYRNLEYVKIRLNRKDNDYKLLEDHLINSRVDLFHSPNNGLSIPQNKICKYIITVHDLSPVSHRELVDDKYYYKFNALFPNAVEKADCIIAVSKFIKEELIKLYRIPDKKIEVVYPWHSGIFKAIDLSTARTELKDRYKIDGKFILYAGSIHARKNLDVLIKALKLLLNQTNDIKLVIAGNYDTKRREYYFSLKKLIHKLGIEKHIIFTDTVPYTDMPYFYNCAECTVNLSSYDGFPTTAVEAIACSSPVVCSRSSSFEEVLGQAAVFLDNGDVNLLKNKLLEIIIKNSNRILSKNRIQLQDTENSLKKSVNKLVRIYESTVYGP